MCFKILDFAFIVVYNKLIGTNRLTEARYFHINWSVLKRSNSLMFSAFQKEWRYPLRSSLDRNRQGLWVQPTFQHSSIHKCTFHSGHLNLMISCRRRRSSSLRLQSSRNSTDVDNSSASADGSSSSVCVHLVWSAVVVGGDDPANWPPSACWSSGILLSPSPLICWRLAGGSASSGLERSTDEGVLTVPTSHNIRYHWRH